MEWHVVTIFPATQFALSGHNIAYLRDGFYLSIKHMLKKKATPQDHETSIIILKNTRPIVGTMTG